MTHHYSEEDRRQLTRAHLQAQNARYTAQVGGGAVQAVVNGLQELMQITIDPKALVIGNAKTLEELIVKAVNQANRAAAHALVDQMQGLRDAMGIDFAALRDEKAGKAAK